MYIKEHEIRYLSKGTATWGKERVEKYRDSEWDACISHYLELEEKDYTVVLYTYDTEVKVVRSNRRVA